jgi:hypothetical protein
MNELMDRLARANPASADEPLTAEKRRESDALLERILADEAAPVRPRRGPAPRRFVPAAAVLATLVIAAVITLDLVDSEEGGAGIVERAVAAVTKDDVIYAITLRATARSVALEPGIEATPDERMFERTWLWGEGERSRALKYRLLPDGRPGRLVQEVVSTPDRIVWLDSEGQVMLDYSPDDDDAWPRPSEEDTGDGSAYPGFDPAADPGGQLREHVDSGRLQVAGRTTVRGRTAYRLVAKAEPDARPDDDFGTLTYLVDARTYLPLEMRQRVVFDHSDVPGGGRERVNFRVEYLRYEALPVNDDTKRLVEMGPQPGANRVP